MQILPTQNSRSGIIPLDGFALSQTLGGGSGFFADLMKIHAAAAPGAANPFQAAASRPESIHETARAVAAEAKNEPRPGVVEGAGVALTEPAAPACHADGPLRGVKIAKEEYAGLREKLEAAGVPKEKLDELEKKIQSPEGLSWGQLKHALHSMVMQQYLRPVNFTAEDKASVASMLGRIGFDPKQAGDLASALENGKAGKAFAVISARLKELDPAKTVTVPRQEMESFAKALNLSGQSAAKLLSPFAGKDGLELNAQGLSQLFTVAMQERKGLLDQAKQAVKEVKDALAPALTQARERITAERQADQTKVASAQAKPSMFLADPQAAALKTEANGPAKALPGKDDDQQKAADSKDGLFKSGPAKAAPNAQNDPLAVNKDGRQQANQHPAGGETGRDPKGNPERAWSEFVSKVKLEGEHAAPADARLAGGQSLAGTAGGFARAAAEAGHVSGPRAASFLDQVESGILRNLGQGVRQLSLELTPEAVGKLNVVLTVKGKEVQALIKAETPEAERLLAENLQQIKQSLENQGLTVSKLEVRAGLQQDAGMNQQWNGAEKHNLSQERRETLERIRTAALLAEGAGEAGLVRGMQNGSREARISQGGLDLIA
jgi:flagellar hook-length control protein FliK